MIWRITWLGLFLLFSGLQEDKGASSDDAREARWSEESDVVLVPKRLLSDFSVQSLTITDLEQMQFALTDEFAKTFKLSRSEIEEVNRAIADALHEYRVVEGTHLLLTNEEPKIGKGRELEQDDERLHFRLTPFPKEALGIRSKLEEELRASLGKERSKAFWVVDLVGGEMPTFTGPPFNLPDAKITVTYTFVRPARNPREVSRYVATYHENLGGSGGGVSGRPLGEPMDQYAPEELKPVLGRWRKEEKARRDAENATRAPGDSALERRNGKVSVEGRKSGDLPAAAAPRAAPEKSGWNEREAFAEVSKDAVSKLRIPGLTVDEELSEEAITLFDVSAQQVKAVNGLYHELRIRFESTERAHFERVAPGQNSFVLRAFPEKSAELNKEWLERLKSLVGASRGELLDDSVRTSISPRQLMKGDARAGAMRRWVSDGRGRTWMHRGTTELRVDVTKGVDARGRSIISSTIRRKVRTASAVRVVFVKERRQNGGDIC